MPVLSKAEIDRPVRRAETVECEALGGEVIVQALLLSEKMQYLYGGDRTFADIPRLLAMTVVDAERQPLMTAYEWELWGTDHIEAVLALFDKSKALSGLSVEDSEKKSETPTGDSSTA